MSYTEGEYSETITTKIGDIVLEVSAHEMDRDGISPGTKIFPQSFRIMVPLSKTQPTWKLAKKDSHAKHLEASSGLDILPLAEDFIPLADEEEPIVDEERFIGNNKKGFTDICYGLRAASIEQLPAVKAAGADFENSEKKNKARIAAIKDILGNIPPLPNVDLIPRGPRLR